MNRIRGIEKVEQAIGRWSPSDLAIVDGISLKQNHSKSILIVDALFQPRTDSWPDFDSEMYRVSIVFGGVSGLQLKDFGGGGVQIMGFDIHDIGDNGWENINFEIEDYEDGRISFNCSDISIQSVRLHDSEYT